MHALYPSWETEAHRQCTQEHPSLMPKYYQQQECRPRGEEAMMMLVDLFAYLLALFGLLFSDKTPACVCRVYVGVGLRE